MKIFKNEDVLTDVFKIIKPPYTQEEYPELYEKISFAVSGSNASAALISLAEEVGLNLNYREHHKYNDNGIKDSLFCRYF
jgi:hypothetical protein